MWHRVYSVYNLYGVLKGPVSYRCGKECTQCTTCIVYQTNEAKKQCELFNFSPKNYTKINQCKAYYTISDVDVKNARITTKSCSYPFTFNGALYFSCSQITPSLCDAWCFNMNAQQLTCSKDDYAYAAQNVTVNLVIPVTNAVVPVRSVHQWITIMSRVDSNFPWSQTFQAYQDGFGDPASNFWLGLNRIYYLTNSAVNGGHTYRLRFELLSAGNSKWYSMEYERFYLDPGTSFTFRVSGSAYGDAGDMVMNIGSPVNGSPFTTSGIYCFASYGPWWYTGEQYCCHCRLFGRPSTVSWEQIGTLSTARMMIRLVQ